MDKFTIGMLATGAGVILIALRIQIGVALGIVSFFGIATILGWRPAWGMVTAIPFNFVGDWNLTAIPMFLLMGYIAFSAGLTAGLFPGDARDAVLVARRPRDRKRRGLRFSFGCIWIVGRRVGRHGPDRDAGNAQVQVRPWIGDGRHRVGWNIGIDDPAKPADGALWIFC